MSKNKTEWLLLYREPDDISRLNNGKDIAPYCIECPTKEVLKERIEVFLEMDPVKIEDLKVIPPTEHEQISIANLDCSLKKIKASRCTNKLDGVSIFYNIKCIKDNDTNNKPIFRFQCNKCEQVLKEVTYEEYFQNLKKEGLTNKDISLNQWNNHKTECSVHEKELEDLMEVCKDNNNNLDKEKLGKMKDYILNNLL